VIEGEGLLNERIVSCRMMATSQQFSTEMDASGVEQAGSYQPLGYSV